MYLTQFQPLLTGDSSLADRREGGLSSAEAARKLRRDGLNLLPTKPPPPVWWLLAAQMVHFFAIMLWVAGGLAILAGMSQLGSAIFVVIVLNGLFAFIQEHRAERASEKLRDLLPRRAMVLRDGTPLEISAAELVVDDVVLLRAGDRISADLKLLEVHGLSVDTHLNSYVERQNLTMRMQMRRFTPLTNAFSKKIENHTWAIALHYMHYNFCRIHQTLRVTPAMETGIADHIWSIEEVVGLLAEEGERAA